MQNFTSPNRTASPLVLPRTMWMALLFGKSIWKQPSSGLPSGMAWHLLRNIWPFTSKTRTPLRFASTSAGWLNGWRWFPQSSGEMKGIEWGLLHNRFKDTELDPDALERQIKALLMDDEVTNKKASIPVPSPEKKRIWAAGLSPLFRGGRLASGRAVSAPIVMRAGKPKVHYEFDEMEADHITPWSRGSTFRRSARCGVGNVIGGRVIYRLVSILIVKFPFFWAIMRKSGSLHKNARGCLYIKSNRVLNGVHNRNNFA